MSKPNLTANRPIVPTKAGATSIDAHLFDTPTVETLTKPNAAVAPAELKSPSDNGFVTRLAFSNQLKPDVYVMLRQYEHHAAIEVQEILDEALRAYLGDKPLAQQPLPPRAAAKLDEKLRKK